MKAKTLAAGLVAATTLVLAGTAAASGGVSIEQGNSWDGFPAASQPGDSLSVTVCTFQAGAEGSHATVRFGGLNAAGLTFVSSGDGTVSSQGPNQVTVSYTDYAHSAKCDGYRFTLSAAQAPGSYPVHVTVDVQGVGQKGETLTVTVPFPGQPVPVGHSSSMQLCYSVGGSTYTATTDEAAGLIGSGYWAATAAGFNPDGTPALSCLAPQAGTFENAGAASQYTDNNGDLFGVAQATLGSYPVGA